MERKITRLTVTYGDGKAETWTGTGRMEDVLTEQEHPPGSKNMVPTRYVIASLSHNKKQPNPITPPSRRTTPSGRES